MSRIESSSPAGGGSYFLLLVARSAASYREVATHDHRYWATPLYPAHARLNQAFTEAIQQIRDQMLRDRDAIMAGMAR